MIICRAFLSVAVLLATLFATPLAAQTRDHAALRVRGAGAHQVDVEALAEALSVELAMPVTGEDQDARILIEISVHGMRATLVVRDEAGATHRRVAQLHRDPRERIERLVIPIINLARNEASELLAAMRQRRELAATEASENPPEAQNPPEQALATPEQALAPPEQALAAPEPTPAPVVEEPVGEPLAEAAAEPEPEPEAEPIDAPIAPTASPAFMRIGLGTQLGSTPAPRGLDLAWLAGLEVAFMPTSFLAFGIRELGGGLAHNSRWHAGGALFVELDWKPIPELELYGGVGAHVQYIDGASRPYSLGVAPLVNLGARIFATSDFSIGFDTELRGVATETFHSGMQVIPQGAMLWTGGLHLLFHIR